MILERVGPPAIRFVAVSDDTSRTWACAFVGAVLGIPTGLIAGLIFVAIR